MIPMQANLFEKGQNIFIEIISKEGMLNLSKMKVQQRRIFMSHVMNDGNKGEMNDDRKYWIEIMNLICQPVLENLSNRKLKETMPVIGVSAERKTYTYLEALGRTLTGISPWLECRESSGLEKGLQEKYAVWAREAIDAGTDPNSPDYMNFSEGHQPIVDAAFLAQAILRAPYQLWEKLTPNVKTNLVQALVATRSRLPAHCNWLLFSAIIEAALYRMGERWDRMRIDYALRQHEQWYKGDGVYGDGADFRWDYYNSFVIQPMLMDILETVGSEEEAWKQMKPKVLDRAKRYAEVLERLISPEGTYPPMGRSLAYRFGSFQLLSHISLREELPESVTPPQVRSALTAVIMRTIKMPGTFDEGGWLQIGFCGQQKDLGEHYISTGSLYLCSAIFLPLGLKESSSFWQGKSRSWTAKKIWNGENIAIDTALIE
jgi:hypothetical protein